MAAIPPVHAPNPPPAAAAPHVFDPTGGRDHALRRRMTRRYAAALGLVALLTLGNGWLLTHLVSGSEVEGAIITVAGGQRMLSQRIAALSAVATEPGEARRGWALGELDRAADHMARMHAQLTYGARAPARATPELAAVYFGGPDPLDGAIHRFLEQVARFRAAPDGDADARQAMAIQQEALGPLMYALTTAVELHQDAARRQVGRTVAAQHAAMVLILLALVAEALLIFRPLTRQIGQTLGALAREASIDALTGLLNRGALRAAVDHALSEGRPLAVITFDLDWFKEANEAEGHACGDAVLVETAARLRATMRQTDLLARMGGDEFVAVVLPVDARVMLDRIAARLHEALHLPVNWDGRVVRTGASIGVAVAPADGTTADALLRVADAALGRAKRAGRGRILFAEPRDAARVGREAAILRAIREAAEEVPGLTARLRPRIDPRDGRLAGFTAVPFWRHPDLGELAPSEFLGPGARAGLLARIAGQCRRAAVAAFAAARREGLTAAWLGLPLSAAELSDPGVIDRLEADVRAAGLPTSCLDIEITEDVLLDRVSLATRERLLALRGRGPRLVLGAFGTGHAGFPAVLGLPLDAIRLDATCVAGLGVDRAAGAVVRAAAGLAEALGLDLLAEGVATEGQQAALRALGCAGAEGPLYGPPMLAADLPAWRDANRHRLRGPGTEGPE